MTEWTAIVEAKMDLKSLLLESNHCGPECSLSEVGLEELWILTPCVMVLSFLFPTFGQLQLVDIENINRK